MFLCSAVTSGLGEHAGSPLRVNRPFMNTTDKIYNTEKYFMMKHRDFYLSIVLYLYNR